MKKRCAKHPSAFRDNYPTAKKGVIVLGLLFISLAGFSQVGNEYLNKKNGVQASGIFPVPTDSVYFIGHSYVFGANASVTSRRWSSIVAAAMNCIEVNKGVSGTTLMLQLPKDYQGATSLTERMATDIPTKTANRKALFIDIGLNDAGQTATAYTIANYQAAWDSVLNNAITTKGWKASQIFILGVEFIGQVGLNYYGTINSNTNPTYARMQQFDAANKYEANKWACNFIETYNKISNNDTTLIGGTGSVHPTDAGYAFIAKTVLQNIGVPTLPIQQFQTLTDGSTITWDLNYGKKAAVTIAGSRTLTITNAVSGDKVTLEVTQDATGGRSLFPSAHFYSNLGLFSLNPGTSAKTIIDGTYDGSQWFFNLQNVYAQDPTAFFISQLTALGYTPGGTEATGYQVFHDSLVAQGLWSTVQVFYPFAGTSAATQSLNYLNPVASNSAYYISWNGTITRSINGWKGNGTTGYGNTNYSPSANGLTLNNTAFTVWFTDASVTGNQAVGANDAGSPNPYMGINYNYDGTHTAAAIGGNNSLINISNPTVNQCFTVSRTSSTALSMYANGSSIGSTATAVTVGLPAANIYLAALDGAGTAGAISAQQYCFYMITTGLTSAQATTLYGDLNRLKTAMGR